MDHESFHLLDAPRGRLVPMLRYVNAGFAEQVKLSIF